MTVLAAGVDDFLRMIARPVFFFFVTCLAVLVSCGM
jgi:hypothetical protein